MLNLLKILFSKEDISSNALEHSSKGEFTKGFDGKPINMKSGGHGQENIDYLKKHNLKYSIDAEYKNGVRLGSVYNHKDKKQNANGNHTWFPKNWDRKKIKNAGKIVAQSCKCNGLESYCDGRVNKVDVRIKRNNGKISTIHPIKTQNSKFKYDNRNKG